MTAPTPGYDPAKANEIEVAELWAKEIEMGLMSRRLTRSVRAGSLVTLYSRGLSPADIAALSPAQRRTIGKVP